MSTMFDVLKSYHPEGDKKTVEDMTKLALSSERRLALLEMREAVYQELQDYLSADKPDAKTPNSRTKAKRSSPRR